ncbi:MAG: cytochrome C, class I [Alphaproteobacteria bacterium]|nr:cytochrome C, class I [Alphaproteobacteria bacterium]
MTWRSLSVVALLAAAPTMANTPVELLAGGCQGCHGVAGAGANGIPMIMRAQPHEDFIATMRAFRDNQREATVMGRIARGYTDAEIAALAAHFARQP